MARTQRSGMTETTQAVLTDDPNFLRVLVEQVIQEVLDAEMTAHLNAVPYERSGERKGYRNGYKPRQLQTRVGTLALRMPQDRDGTFATEVFARYQRGEKALMLALMEMYVEGSRRARCARSPKSCAAPASRRASFRSWPGNWTASWRHGESGR